VNFIPPSRRFLLFNKLCLSHVIFSDLQILPYCVIFQIFPPDGVDGMTFAELIHHTCPLFHQNDTSTIINPSDHGHVLAEKLSSVRKDLKREYDAVMVNFMVW